MASSEEQTPTDSASTRVDGSTLLGRTLADRYVVRQLLSRGGMGRVYRADQLPLGRQVALKVLDVPPGAEDPDAFRARFLREAATLAQLKNPNTVTVFDYGYLEDSDTYYMVMELVEGHTLKTILSAQGAMTSHRSLRIAYEIARSLAEAHAHGVVHRDLKPSNIMLLPGDEGEAVKVLDFGIAKVHADEAEGADAITRDDRLLGTPRYMAPEQIRNEALDGRTDLYSLGTVLFEMLTGAAPFSGGNSMVIMAGHIHKPVPPLRRPDGALIPEAVEDIVLRCLEKRPTERYADANTFKEAVRVALGTLDDTQDVPVEFTSETDEIISVPPQDPDATTLVQPTHPVPPPPAAAQAPWGWAVGFVGLLAVLALGLAGWQAVRGTVEPSVGAVEALPPPRATDEPYIAISSFPPGAEVFDGGTSMGRTPLIVDWPLGVDEPPRVLEVRMEGYRTWRAEQGPVRGTVEIRAMLESLEGDPAMLEPPKAGLMPPDDPDRAVTARPSAEPSAPGAAADDPAVEEEAADDPSGTGDTDILLER